MLRRRKCGRAISRNFTEAKMKKRPEQVEKSIARYLEELDKAYRHSNV